MRFSDALGVLSQHWKVPVSELMSYHRALRDADMIPAQARGRGKDHISEDTLARFVIAYCSSRQANTSPDQLRTALEMVRPVDEGILEVPIDPAIYKHEVPEMFLQTNILDTLLCTLSHFRHAREELQPIEFIFGITEQYIHIEPDRGWYPKTEWPNVTFGVMEPFFVSKDNEYYWNDGKSDELAFETIKIFRNETIIVLNKILAG
jgi:hypothetical protein